MQNHEQITVMGPAHSSTPSRLYEPSALKPTSDKLQWRKRIRTWARFIRRLARGGDPKAVSAYNALGITIYQSLDESFAGKIDSAIDAGLFVLEPEENQETDPMETLEKIIELIAKDSVTETVRRLVSMLKQVYACKREHNESTAVYANRFEAIARRYLNNCSYTTSQQDSQNFAMLILENANLPDESYNTVISQMVTKAKERGTSVEPVVSVPQEIFKKLKEEHDACLEKCQFRSATESSQNENLTQEQSNEILAHLKKTSEIFAKQRRIDADRDITQKSGIRLTLDDAIEAIIEVKVGGSTFKRDPLNNEVKTGSLLGKRMHTDKEPQSNGTGPENGKRRKYIPPGEGPKKNSRCKMCKQIGHWWTDAECIFNKIKNSLEAQQKDDDGNAERSIDDVGSDTLQPDPNPILDEGAPTSTAGILDAAKLCEILGIPFKLEPPRSSYMHGWGDDCLGAKPIIASWTLTVLDTRKKPTSFTFDLVFGSSPMILGMDVRKYTNTFNLHVQRYLDMKRPTDKENRIFFTYIAEGDERLRLDIAPHPLSTVSTLLGNIHTTTNRTPLTFCKRVHRYTHATAEEMRDICKDAGILSEELNNAIERVVSACELCTKNGRPKPTKKVSLSHVSEEFNEELQIDFAYATIKQAKIVFMVMTDVGTGYSETAIASDRKQESISTLIETKWICHHGAPKRISADDEYNRSSLISYLRTHDITFCPRPTRRHNKTGKVERKIGTIKAILKKLNDEQTSASTATILARATLLSNMFSGSRLLSSFELARGYSPAIVGIPSTIITQELLDSHKEQVAIRALQRLLHSHAPTITRPDLFHKDDPIWVFYKSTKQNEDNEWVKAHVLEASEHFITARRANKGPPMKVAYEDVRIAPRSELTDALLSCSLEEELESPATAEDIQPNGGNNVPIQQPDSSTAHHTSLYASNENPTCKDATKDIGPYAQSVEAPLPQHNVPSDSDRTEALAMIYEEIGSQQVTSRALDFAPPYILDQAFRKEVEDNWNGSFAEVQDCNVPRSANVISSHAVYKVKTEEDGSRYLKARIVAHGNRDKEKDDIRKDSSTAPLFVVRLLLSLTTFLGFRLASADIKGAYLQSGPIRRDIFVRPPREWKGKRGTLWKLLKLPYGIVEAGRQWQKAVEEWMLTSAGLERVLGVTQLFVKRNITGKIILLVAKVTDDFLISGSHEENQRFLEQLQKRFVVGKIVTDDVIHFDGCEISQKENGDIEMSMRRYLDRIKPIEISRSRRKQQQDKATDSEIKQYRSLAATLMYLGNGVLPQASYITSALQQQLPRITVEHLVEANKMTQELLKHEPLITYRKPQSVTDVTVCTFADASFNSSSAKDYGQTGIVTGLRISTEDGEDLFHAIDWCSQKQRRVSYSPYGAEILACAAADDRCFYFKTTLNSLFPDCKIKNELFTDSKCLYDTITTLHEGQDFRLRPTVQRMRNSFESEELDAMRWIPGTINPADAVTKRNPNTSAILNRLLSEGTIAINLESGYCLQSAT